MGYDWREKSPLGNADKYLWRRLKKYPDIDWRDSASRDAMSPLHVYYEEGWEQIHSLGDALFCCSSQTGGHGWIFAHQSCRHPECTEKAEALVNSVRTKKKDNHGDDLFVWLDDAPRFLCYPHYHELQTGKVYVPPTAEETRLMSAQFRAMERMITERPPEKIELDGGLTIDSFTMMDGSYLRRLAEITKQEYEKLGDPHTDVR